MPKAILFDMDGVLYTSEEPIAGAAETLEWVHAQVIPHLFVTNTTSRGRGALVEKLARLGILATDTEILTPSVAPAEWLRAHEEGAVALFVRPSARGEFEGSECLSEQAEGGARYVVIGDLEDAWDFRTLNRAFRLLHSNPDATLIALGMTRFWQTSDGVSLDVAPFVAALEHAIGRKAVVFGKPAEAFFGAAVEKLQIPAAEILMIGDDIETDIAGAQRAGLKGALVKTGKFRPGDLERGVEPDVVLESVASLPDWWADYRSGTVHR
jgi:phospholysine phosphohistidine inorganic pyrophosphate phosphatase